jgi:SAM-dependent methyltransferase
VPDADFRVGDVQALPYADKVFDAVIAADVLPYVTDPLAALRELRRVCARQGRVVVALWGAPEECMQNAIVAAVRTLLPRPLDAQPFALSAPGVLDALIAQAGLAVCDEGTVACPWDYPDAETAWLALASDGLLQAAIRLVGPAPLKAALLHAVAPYQTSTGGVCLQNRFRYVVATPHAAGEPAM